VVVSLGHLEWQPPPGVVVAPSTRTGSPYPEVFDVTEPSYHEYGNRVGIFRILQLLDRHGITPMIAMDAFLAERAPTLVDYLRDRDCEFVGHGVALSRMITEEMSGAEERDYIEYSLRTLERATGSRPVGWLSPDYGASSRTTRILAELGLSYVCDWPNDEQPYRLRVPTGQIVSLPVSVELDDVVAHRGRGVPIAQWAQMVIEAFERLYNEGERDAKLLVLNMHPHVLGQPFRSKHLDRVLKHIAGRDAVWHATGSEVVDCFLQQNVGSDETAD
jgi:peptidoglycan/xylan/chitin deacetylase (PgdA/CDA1 family)